jgi:hypothetical protein
MLAARKKASHRYRLSEIDRIDPVCGFCRTKAYFLLLTCRFLTLSQGEGMRQLCAILIALVLVTSPAIAKGSGSNSGTSSSHIATSAHARATPGVARNSHGRITRSEHARREFRKSYPCPSTSKTTGACPGYVIAPQARWRGRAVQHAVADHRGSEGEGSMGIALREIACLSRVFQVADSTSSYLVKEAKWAY